VRHPDFPSLSAIVLALLALAMPVFAHADELQVPQLMRMLAQNKSDKARFVEKKYIGFIDVPLFSSGTLSFVAPDRLEKRTLKPKPETMILDGDTLILERPGKNRLSLSLDDHPEVAAFIESIRGTMAGDLSTLQSFYTLKLAGSAKAWQLTLTPKQEKLNSIFEYIVIHGSGADIDAIELTQRDGDHSEMVITRSGARQ